MSIGGICGVRLIWIYGVFPQHPTYETLLLVYPVSWFVTTVAIIIAYFIVSRKVLGSLSRKEHCID